MTFFIPMLYLIGITSVVMCFAKRRFEEVLPVSIMLNVLIVYLSGLLGLMEYALRLLKNFNYLGGVFILLAGLALIFGGRRHASVKEFEKRLFTPGFACFVLLYVFVGVLNFARGVTLWDEFSHWAPMVKETLRLNNFYCVGDSALLVHKDYPPAVSLWQSVWCALCGAYSEAYLYRSLQMLMFSLYIPCLSGFRWSKKLKDNFSAVIAVFIIILSNLVISLDIPVYTVVYIDALVGLLLAYGIACVFYDQKATKFTIFRLTVTLSFFLLVKQIAIAFSLLIVTLFVINIIITQRKEITGYSKLSIAAAFLCITVIPLVINESWIIFSSKFQVARQFELSAIRPWDLLDIWLGKGEAFQWDTLINYMEAIWTRPLIQRPIELNYFQLIVLMILIFSALKKTGGCYFKKYQFEAFVLLLCLGSLGYAFAMLLTYVFCFGSYEGPILASFQRYINTYWFGMAALWIMLFLLIEGKNFRERQQSPVKRLALVLAVFCLWIPPDSYRQLAPVLKYQSAGDPYTGETQNLAGKTPEDSKIFLIAQGQTGRENYLFAYKLLPRRLNTFGFSLGEPYTQNNRQDVWTQNWTADEWREILRGWDYVYLNRIDEQFKEGYGEVFEENAELENGKLYRVNVDENNTVTLNEVD